MEAETELARAFSPIVIDFQSSPENHEDKDFQNQIDTSLKSLPGAINRPKSSLT
jgi:hypothetical protein